MRSSLFSTIAIVSFGFLSLNGHSAAAGPDSYESRRGRIETTDGQPLEGAVACLNLWLCGCSDENGDFVIESDGHLDPLKHDVVHASLEGYLPRTVVSDAAEELRITLNPGNDGDWTIPICPSTPPPGSQLVSSGSLAVMVPDNARLSTQSDADYSCTFVGLRWRRGRLVFCGGPHWSSGLPSSSILDRVEIHSEQSLVLGDPMGCPEPTLEGVDLRGTDDHGRSWRTVGGVYETIEYRVKSSGTASVFDSWLSTLCRARLGTPALDSAFVYGTRGSGSSIGR